MPTFKGYTKEATSDTTLRIDKRERILAVIISGYATGRAVLERTNPTPAGLRRRDMSWPESNLTTLQIKHRLSEREAFEWKLALIEDTGWLADSNQTVYEKDGYLVAEWSDTQKLRIFFNWLHKGKQYTIQKVLKYMYSPLFIAMFMRDNALYLDHEDSWKLTTGFHTRSRDSELLQAWMKDVLGYESKPCDQDELLIKGNLLADALPYIQAF